MQQVTSFGEVPWTRDELVAALEEFANLYRNRPIPNNAGGMKAPHMFSTWFGLKRLAPKAVVESGVWLGQGTWLIEQACPQADLYCIEPVLDRIQYRSKKARYFDRDFATLDWTALPAQETVLFFDDHQNAYESASKPRSGSASSTPTSRTTIPRHKAIVIRSKRPSRIPASCRRRLSASRR